MTTYKYLIIGAGPAALSAVNAIRQSGDIGSIALITRENCDPYSPASLPYLFDDEISEEGLFFKGIRAVAKHGVTLLKGKTVTAINKEKKEVLAGNESIGYEKLLITTGAHPDVKAMERFPGIPFDVLRTFKDYQGLKDGSGIIIYGAGLVAIELAEKLAHKGVSVTVIARSRLLRKYFHKETTDLMAEILTKIGVKLYQGVDIESIDYREGRYNVSLADGTAIEGNRFVCATGVKPTIPFEGLELEHGAIKTDGSQRTNLPDVYAAGDAAAVADFFTGKLAPFAILTEAIEQGRVAGSNMAGQKETYAGGISSNILRCGKDYFFSVGNIEPDDQTTLIAEKEDASFFCAYLKNDVLVGAVAWNHPEYNAGVFRYLIYKQVKISGKTADALKRDPEATALYLMNAKRRQDAVGLITTK